VSNRKIISLDQEVDAARQDAAAARQEAAEGHQDAADATLRLQTAQETIEQTAQISAAGEPIPTLMLEKGSQQSVNCLLSPDKHMVSARRSSVSALSCLQTPCNGVWAGIHRRPRPASPPDSAPSLHIEHSPATTSGDDKGGVLPLTWHEVRLLANTMTGFDMEVARLQATGATVCGNDEKTPAQLAIQFIDRDLTESRVKCPKISSLLSLPVLCNHNETQATSFKALETLHLKTRLRQAEAWSRRERVQKLQSSF